MLDAIGKINPEVVRRTPEERQPQETEGRGVAPPVNVEAGQSETAFRYHDYHPDNHNTESRFDRVECPTYDGTTAFRSWLYKCELEINQVPENRKIRSIYYKLNGSALEWHQCWIRREEQFLGRNTLGTWH